MKDEKLNQVIKSVLMDTNKDIYSYAKSRSKKSNGIFVKLLFFLISLLSHLKINYILKDNAADSIQIHNSCCYVMTLPTKILLGSTIYDLGLIFMW